MMKLDSVIENTAAKPVDKYRQTIVKDKSDEMAIMQLPFIAK
jgi:hypothetical protein